MYLSGEWHTLHLKTAADGLMSTCSRPRSQPVLGIRTCAPTSASIRRRHPRHAGARAARELGRRRRGVSLYPVSVKDLMRVSDAGGIMPPKSTWFEPQLRDGLLSHVI
jgi:uncharacterized protein (DUF1015 family)